MLGWFGRKRPPKAEPVPPLALYLTPLAHQQLAAVLARQAQPAALRIFVRNPGESQPQYDMALEPADMVRDGDVVIDSDGLRVLIDADSQSAIDGATVDFRDDPLQPGFVVNPPSPASVAIPSAFDASDPLAAQVQSVLVHHVNPHRLTWWPRRAGWRERRRRLCRDGRRLPGVFHGRGDPETGHRADPEADDPDH